MDTTHRTGDPVIASMRDHVLTPLARAERAVEAERGEVEAEWQAFSEFRERVAGVDVAPTPDRGLVPGARAAVVEKRPHGSERARAIFRETVMGVDHYDETYDETLEEHATAEFSSDVASILQPGTATPFTEWHRTMLISATDRAIAGRKRFCDLLAEESSSLESSRTVIAEVMDSLDGPDSPTRYGADSDALLNEVSQARQERIQDRKTPARTDGHDLCQYLYGDHEWTYPVLTAVTRLRSAVV